ncbi:MAG: hypothetical protein Q9173_004523 [Seirophora scorigena]
MTKPRVGYNAWLTPLLFVVSHRKPFIPSIASCSIQPFIVLQLSQSTAFVPSHWSLPRDAASGGVELRILPLGDSITWGQYSSDGNGYRLALYDSLTPSNHVTFIGREKSGTMANNENEGHPGFPIRPVGQMGKPDYALRPNVILLMAGTNDVVLDIDLDAAPAAMGNVMDDIVSACPDAALLVAEITPFLDAEREKKRETFNNALKEVVAARAGDGKQAALASMDRFTAQGHLNLTDGIHPNDEGYKQIAAVWFDAIVAAGNNGWIKPPLPMDPRSKVPAASPPPTEVMTPAQFAVYATLVFGAVVVGRRGLAILLRRRR